METAAIRDQRLYGRQGDTFSHGHHHPMSPPEDSFDRSRSSSAQSDGKHDARQNPIGIDALLRATAQAAKTSQRDGWHGAGGVDYPTQSTPYQTSSRTRPSLPPLKNVLADSMVSPPTTPRSPPSSLQPSPREPAYTTKTYKPPALYPSKRSRNEPSSSTVPRSLVDNTPASMAAYRYAPGNAAHSYGRSDGVTPIRHASDGPLGHGLMSRPMAAPTAKTAMDGYMTPISDYERAGSSTHSYYVPADAPDLVSRSYDRRHSENQLAYRGPSRREMGQQLPEASRGPSDHGETRHHISSVHGQSNEAEQPRYRQIPFHPRSAAYAASPHEHSRLASGHGYEYQQQSKARKRSNLPKQSTEIMKTWFDRNISNPYPSEEQKAIFSNATGISMTQVSNWFINHRRRCPELRDKREKSRNGDEHDT